MGTFFEDLQEGLVDASKGISGARKQEVFNSQQAQQNEVIALERERMTLLGKLASTGSGLSTGAIIGIVVGVLVVIGGIVYLIMRKK